MCPESRMTQLVYLSIHHLQDPPDPRQPWAVQFQTEHMARGTVWLCRSMEEAEQIAILLQYMPAMSEE